MTKVVLDTNTLISGFLWHGNEEKLLLMVNENKIKLYISEEILKEITGVIHRPKFTKVLNTANLTPESILEYIVEKSVIVKPKQKFAAVKKDAEDNKFLECAVEAKADYIISGDKHLLELKELKGIKIVKTKEFLEK